jgi:hypothetical protein
VFLSLPLLLSSPQLVSSVSLSFLTVVERVFRLYHTRHAPFFTSLLGEIAERRLTCVQCDAAIKAMHIETSRLHDAQPILESEKAEWTLKFLRIAEAGKKRPREAPIAGPPPAAPAAAGSVQPPRSQAALGLHAPKGRSGASHQVVESSDEGEADTQAGADGFVPARVRDPSHGYKAKYARLQGEIAANAQRYADNEETVRWQTAELAVVRDALYMYSAAGSAAPSGGVYLSATEPLVFPSLWLRAHAPLSRDDHRH